MNEAYSGRTKYDEQRASYYREKAERRRGPENDILVGIVRELKPNGVLLDAPCGVGRVLDVLGELPCDYLGVDLSPSMLAHAGRRGSEAKGADVAFVRGDLERLPLGDGVADVSICLRFLHHLPDDIRDAVLRELARVTRRALVFTFFHPFALHYVQRRVKEVVRRKKRDRYSHTAAWMSRRLEASGFRLDRVIGTGYLRETRYAVYTRSPPV